MTSPGVRAIVDRSISDDDVVRACLDGRSWAWTELIGRYGAYVYGVATRAYRLDPGAAEEVFQDVCVRIYDGLRGYRGDGLRAWIRQVTISACRDHFRRLGKQARLISIDGHDPAEPDTTDQDLAMDVRAAVAAMGDPCRATIELAFFEDLTQAEAAKRLEVPEGTIAARISRCLRRLRDRMQENPSPDSSREP